MNDNDILNKLRDQAKDTPIPEELEPQNISDKIKNTKQKKPNPWPKYMAIAASFLVIGISISILTINKNLSSNILPKSDDTNIEESINADKSQDSETTNRNDDIDSCDEDLHVKSYKDIYNIFNDNYQRYQNSKDALTNGIAVDMIEESAEDTVDANRQSNSSDDSNKTSSNEDLQSDKESTDFSDTNIQVDGVDEADIVKTDGKYIYVCRVDEFSPVVTIDIAKADDGKLTYISRIIIEDTDTDALSLNDIYIDGNKLIAITSKSESYQRGIIFKEICDKSVTTAYVYDLSNMEKPEYINSLTQDGYYDSSRKCGQYIYLFTTYSASNFKPGCSANNYIPEVNNQLLDADSIYITDASDRNVYSVITSFDINDPIDYIDKEALLTSADVFYVSNSNIYICNATWKYNGYGSQNATQLLKISFDEGKLSEANSVYIKGIINNQFSLDEYNGYLRVVSTVNQSRKTSSNGGMNYNYDSYLTNSLYVLDSDLKLTGKIENLAKDETIYSARFYGDTGYFVTYRNTDPLFSVDLSNPNKPVILGALKIPGFSTYMHMFDEGLLLGIGYETDPESGWTTGIKLSMFDVSDPSNVTEVDKYVLEDIYYSPALDDHKAILVNSNKNLIGFCCNEYIDNEKYIYYVFSYNKSTGFTNPKAYTLYDSEKDYVYPPGIYLSRGLYINDYLYIISPGYKINSYKIGDTEIIDSLELN